MTLLLQSPFFLLKFDIVGHIAVKLLKTTE